MCLHYFGVSQAFEESLYSDFKTHFSVTPFSLEFLLQFPAATVITLKILSESSIKWDCCFPLELYSPCSVQTREFFQGKWQVSVISHPECFPSFKTVFSLVFACLWLVSSALKQLFFVIFCPKLLTVTCRKVVQYYLLGY